MIMICLKLHGISMSNSKSYIRNVIGNIQFFHRQKIFDDIHQHFNKLSLHLYYTTQYLCTERQNYNENILQYVSMNKKLNCHHVLAGQNFGILQTADNNYLMYNSKRYYGDSATIAGVTAAIESNTPIVRYKTYVEMLSDCPPVELCQQFLLSLHTNTGLPWWAIIILFTCTTRTLVTLPFSLYQQYIFAKVANLKCEMDDIVKELKRETNRTVEIFGWSESYARSVYNRSLKKQWNELIVRENCHPMKGLILVIMQLPMWIFLSASLRNLCFMLPRPTPEATETFIQLSVEGFGWISNLTVADNYWILPVSLGVINLVNIEIQTLLRLTEPTLTQKIGLNIFRGVSLLMVPLAGYVPSCISLYWVTSSVYGLLQSFIVISPRVRRFVRIPETKLEIKHPYQHLYENMKNKYAWINNKTLV